MVALWHIRNGGRHRCQPPLRRDLDMPVFFPSGPLRVPLSRSWLTSSGFRFSAVTALPEGEPFPGSSPPVRRPSASPRLCRRILRDPKASPSAPTALPMLARFSSEELSVRSHLPCRGVPVLADVPAHRRLFRGPSWDDFSPIHPKPLRRAILHPNRRGRSSLPAPLARWPLECPARDFGNLGMPP